MLADAGTHVLQRRRSGVIEHVAERQHRDAVAGGKRRKLRKPPAVIAMIEAGRAKPYMAGKDLGEGSQRSFSSCGL